MNVEKAYWSANADRIQLSIPFAKVDKANRTVSGFASVDNLDRHDDIIPSDTALKAFNTFRGNLREMHQPVAVGKVLSFAQEPVYDPASQKSYNGVYVTAYVSKGAQDTWEKVLDGTLTGFSIGGGIKDSESKYDITTKSMVRIIKDMDLFELSLVDNPANPLANFTAIVKIGDDNIVKGIATDLRLVNIFYCEKDKYGKMTAEESATCHECDQSMENIGWAEEGDTEKFQSIVENYIGQKVDDEKLSEGGLDMSDANETVAATVDEVAGEVVVEKAVTVEEPTDLAKAVDEIKTFVTKSIADAITSHNEVIDGRFEEITKSWSAQNLTLEGKIDAFTATFNSAKEGQSAVNPGETIQNDPAITVGAEVDVNNGATDPTASADLTVPSKPALNVGPEVDLQKSIDALNDKIEALVKATAVRKSGDLNGRPGNEVQENDLWKGAFFSTDQVVE